MTAHNGPQRVRIEKMTRCTRCNGKGHYQAARGGVVECGPCGGSGRYYGGPAAETPKG